MCVDEALDLLLNSKSEGKKLINTRVGLEAGLKSMIVLVRGHLNTTHPLDEAGLDEQRMRVVFIRQ